MSGHLENYRGTDINGLDPIVIKVYNDLAGTVTRGDVYCLSYERDADSAAIPWRPTLVVFADSDTIKRQIVVALEDIADQKWGLVMYRGYCPKIAAASGVDAIDHYLEGITLAPGVASVNVHSTTTHVVESFGIATTAYAAGFCEGYLFGIPCLITVP